MSIQIPVPYRLVQDEKALAQLIRDILIRAVDGSLNPIQINVDIKITGGGNGLILTSRNGNHTGRLLLENPDGNGNMILSVDPLT